MDDIIVIPFEKNDFIVYENNNICRLNYDDLTNKLKNYKLEHKVDQKVLFGYNVTFDSPYCTAEQNENLRNKYIKNGLPPYIKESFNYNFKKKYSKYRSAFINIISYIDNVNNISEWYSAERTGVGCLTLQILIFKKLGCVNKLDDFKFVNYELYFLNRPS